MDKSHLYIWDDRFLFAGPGFTSGPTSRYAATLLLTVDGPALRVCAEDESAGATNAVLVAPNVVRTLDATGCRFLSLNLDPHSYEYHALARLTGMQPLYALEADNFAPLRESCQALLRGDLDCGTAFRLCAGLVQCISDYKPPNVMIDLRVLHVAQRLKTELPLSLTVEALADGVGLSPDRLTHLFSQQLGLPIRSYLLWAKMRRAAVLLSSGQALTEIAHAVGFADSAHLTRTFKGFFGLTPSFLADSRCVQVRVC